MKVIGWLIAALAVVAVVVMFLRRAPARTPAGQTATTGQPYPETGDNTARDLFQTGEDAYKAGRKLVGDAQAWIAGLGH